MLVTQGVAAADFAGDLDETLAIPPQQRVVLLEGEHAMTGGSGIGDDGPKARFTRRKFVAAGLPGRAGRDVPALAVVEHRGLSVPRRGCGLAGIAVLPVYTRLVEHELAEANTLIADLREKYRRRPRLQQEFDRAELP